MAETFCPLHPYTEERLKAVEAIQATRHCVVHETDIVHIKEDIGEIKLVDTAQWTRINQLQWYVAMGAGGAGVLAFVGSIIGAWLFKK